MSAAPTLTGAWDGIFNYPHTLPPAAFAAVLREEGGDLSGETIEAGDGGTRHALLLGTRAGATVMFVKTYDDWHQTPIRYAGALNDDATEITGRWTMPGDWAGTFIMVRKRNAEETIEEQVGETV